MSRLGFISIGNFPSVPLVNCSDLPAISAIYFVIDAFDQCLYVGKSIDIKARWADHHIWRSLSNYESKRIAFLPTEVDDLTVVENTFIAFFQPQLNIAMKDPLYDIEFSQEREKSEKAESERTEAMKAEIRQSYQLAQAKLLQLKSEGKLKYVEIGFKAVIAQLSKPEMAAPTNITINSHLINRSRVIAKADRAFPGYCEAIMRYLERMNIVKQDGKSKAGNPKYIRCTNRLLNEFELFNAFCTSDLYESVVPEPSIEFASKTTKAEPVAA